MSIYFFGNNSLDKLLSLIKGKFDGLAKVATSGDYGDLNGAPQYPISYDTDNEHSASYFTISDDDSPCGDDGVCLYIPYGDASSDYGHEFYMNDTGNEFYHRSRNDEDGGWNSWARVYDNEYHPMSYNDLSNKPTIPTNTNQLTNGAGYITSSGTAKTISDTLPVSKGGTGATTAANARTNLGLGGAATYGATSSVTSGSSALVTSGAVYNLDRNYTELKSWTQSSSSASSVFSIDCSSYKWIFAALEYNNERFASVTIPVCILTTNTTFAAKDNFLFGVDGDLNSGAYGRLKISKYRMQMDVGRYGGWSSLNFTIRVYGIK